MNKSKVYVFVFCMVFCICISIAQFFGTQQDDDSIDYTDKDNVAAFIALGADEKNEVYQDSSVEVREKLLEAIRKELYNTKVLAASGAIAESVTGVATSQGIQNANYPSSVTFSGFSEPELQFYGEEGKKVIGNGKVFLDLETLPWWAKEVSYTTLAGKSAFVLKGLEGREITLVEGSTNEEGNLVFSAALDGKMGDRVLPSSINAYEIEGKVVVSEDGFSLLYDSSKVQINDLSFERISGAKEESTIIFNEDGFSVTNTAYEIEGVFRDDSNHDGKEWRVVLGDDWSTFIGRDYADSVTFEDIDTTREQVYVAGGTGAPGVATSQYRSVLQEKGEISVHAEQNGDLFRFSKDGEEIDLREIASFDELMENEIYQASSSTMKEVMAAIVQDASKGTMQFLATRIFADNNIVKANGELFNEFLKSANLAESPAGIAISGEDSSGLRSVFVNPKDVGGEISLQTSLRSLVVGPGSAAFNIDVNPSDGKNRMDFSFIDGNMKKVGVVSSFEYGIEEIRLVNNQAHFTKNLDGTFDVYSITRGGDGNYKFTLSDRVTVFTGSINPLHNQFILNNGEALIGSLGIDAQSYVENINQILDVIEQSEGDAKFLVDLLKTGNLLLDVKLPDASREALVKQFNQQLQSLQNNPSIPEEVRSRLPQSIEGVPSSREMRAIISGVDSLQQDFISGLKQDLQSIRENPAVGDVRMIIDRVAAQNLDISADVNDFPDQMERQPWELQIGVSLPEFKTIQNINEWFLYSSEEQAARERIAQTQQSLVENIIAERIIKSYLSDSIFPPQTVTNINFFPDKKPPEELVLHKRYQEGLLSAIQQSLSQVKLQGGTKLVMQNNPSGDFSINVVTSDEVVPINIDIATKNYLKHSIITSMRVPSQLRGFYDPWLGPNVQNAPVSPNNIYAPFCSSVGFKPGFCADLGTARKLEKYIDTYYLQPK